MIFKSKKGETMVWLENIKKMVCFNDGIIDADEKISKELISLGYIAENSKKKTEVKVEEKVVTQPTTETEVKAIKPIKPKGLEVPDSEINSEV